MTLVVSLFSLAKCYGQVKGALFVSNAALRVEQKASLLVFIVCWG